MSHWRWVLLQLTRQLWFRATLIGVLGVAAAALAALADLFSPWEIPFDIGAGAVTSILSILASSMLAVTTFSLNIMTSAFGAAANTVTPRATKLLVEDRVSQNVLSTFIGSFLFSIVGLVVLKAGAYGPQGRTVLFIVTIFVLILVVLALLRWIDQITRLGRVGETTDRIEQATQTALERRLKEPYLGGRALKDRTTPHTAVRITADTTGYVLNVNMASLSGWAERLGATVYLSVIPGTFVFQGTILASVDGAQAPPPLEEEGEHQHPAIDQKDASPSTSVPPPHPGHGQEPTQEQKTVPLDDTAKNAIRQAFTVGDERSFDQDPRFGFSVLSEVASRALSPGVNDPGTAIDVIGRMARLMTLWAKGSEPRDDDAITHPAIIVPALTTAELFDDAFRLIARDGAGLIEVQMRLRKTLRALECLGDQDFHKAARTQAALALKRAEQAMTAEEDLHRLRSITFADTASDDNPPAVEGAADEDKTSDTP